ncbi:hypothetical protein BLD44_020440 [Mastigocladus laminosus UU774]|nr:hypothetical protein BLD44_020440 [Mastigocladus laminosus UU774]
MKLHPFDSQGSIFTNRTRPYRLDFQVSLAQAPEIYWLKPIYNSNKKSFLLANTLKWLFCYGINILESLSAVRVNTSNNLELFFFANQILKNYQLTGYYLKVESGASRRILVAANS